MDARAIASLTVSFGLVAIPVKLYSATHSSGRISFNMLHAKDGSRLKQQYVCVEEGTPVDRSEIVKGYEFAKDRYVVFTAEEIKALEEAGSRIIDVTDFVPLETVDPVYFDHAYYLAPDKGGEKPYGLLAQALRETSRCALGRWASHGREHIVLLRAVEGGLVMQQLHFAAEVRPIRDLAVAQTPIKDAELKLAMRLIEQQASDVFDPTQFVDEVKQRVEAAIARKIEGKEISLADVPREAPPNMVDLMDALRASLDAIGRAPPRKAERKVNGSRAPASSSPSGRQSSGPKDRTPGDAPGATISGAPGKSSPRKAGSAVAPSATAPGSSTRTASGGRSSTPRSPRR
jgi:DNA end-binding protein Ku